MIGLLNHIKKVLTIWTASFFKGLGKCEEAIMMSLIIKLKFRFIYVTCILENILVKFPSGKLGEKVKKF